MSISSLGKPPSVSAALQYIRMNISGLKISEDIEEVIILIFTAQGRDDRLTAEECH